MKVSRVIRSISSVAFVIGSIIAIPVSGAELDDDLFAPDRLIQIEVTMDPQHFHLMRIEHRTTGDDFSQIVEKPYKYYRADVVIDGRTIKSVGIRKKGFVGSAISTRPSLKIKFGKYVDDQDFGGLDMMTFNNNNQDATQAQQFLVYNFMNKAGAQSPRSNLARIIVNGEDLGIYAHVESIRKPFIKRLFGKSNGDLYEGFAGDFTTNEINRIVHKWGKDDDREKLLELFDVIQSDDPVSLANLEKLLDLDAFITMWAAEVLIGHWDGYSGNRNNFYIYRDRGSGRFYFLPWGADSAFRDPGPFIRIEVPRSIKARGYLCDRLWKLSEVRTRYRTEMQRILNDVWDEQKLLAGLVQVDELTRDYSTVSAGSLERNSLLIKTFIRNRRSEIQAELDLPATDWPDLGLVFNPVADTMMEITGEFSTILELPNPVATVDSWSKPVPESLIGKGDASLAFSIDGTTHTPFTTYGARTIPGNPTWIRKGYPIVEIEAVSDSGQPPWRLSLIMDPHQLTEGINQLDVDHFTVWARLDQGDPMSPEFRRKGFGISGELELDSFSSELGATISGRFKLKSTPFEPVEKN